MEYPKKLIEVALPLDNINIEAAREKSIRHGHPSTLHLWWARRPAAARAVLFAQLVNDPGGKRGYGAYKGQKKEDARKERERLFEIIRELVKWENINNHDLLEKAKAEIKKSWIETCKITGDNPLNLPNFHDPFSGGGGIPLEAQRLGLKVFASDLNPVAVTINKAMIELPSKFADKNPVHPCKDRNDFFEKEWKGAQGLAEDVRYYGEWMREEAFKKIGNFYPNVEITKEMSKDRLDLKHLVGKKLTVIAWIWARTVKSPNPAYSHIDVPLTSTFILSSKPGKEAWIKLNIENKRVNFEVKNGPPHKDAQNGTKLGRGANFKCVLSNSPIEQKYIRNEFKSKRTGECLMAIVAQSERGRIYLSPIKEHENIAKQIEPEWLPKIEMNQNSKDLLSGRGYGFKYWYELFTPRQILTLTTFSDLLHKAIEKCNLDAIKSGMIDDKKGLKDDGNGSLGYAEAVGVYLALAISKVSDAQSALCRWKPSMNQSIASFGRQALPMVWDHSEANAFCNMAGDFTVSLNNMMRVIDSFLYCGLGYANQQDAQIQKISFNKVISTDPPYYDNISYADLSDFFYIWLRRSLKNIFPNLYATMAVPKTEELIASSYRHGGKKNAEDFFLKGMTKAIHNIAKQSHPAFPISIYYAFKQSETQNDKGTHSTGWETFLEAVMSAGLYLTGTWPMRTELGNRMVSSGANALASSIVLICRKRLDDSISISRKHFIRELKETFPEALEDMIGGKEGASPIAPVDLAQAAIGPGMAVFSQYKAVLEADGTPMSVHNALILINKTIDEYFTEAEGEMDADTCFCVDWFQQYGFKEGVFGEADVLARAKGTSVEGVQEAGVIFAKSGKVRLLKVSEYLDNWDPEKDKRTPVWEACHYMCRAIQTSESKAGILLSKMKDKVEPIRQLAYRLYTLCERKGWAEDAGLYNGLITSWHAIVEESQKSSQLSDDNELNLIFK